MQNDLREETPVTKENAKKRRLMLWVVLSVLMVGIGLVALHVHRIMTKPETLFTETEDVPTSIPQPTTMAPAFVIATSTPDPKATPAPTLIPITTDGSASAAPSSPTAEPVSPTAEPTTAPNRLNIMLMGIDARENGSSTSGSMPHTDVMMVIAINFDEDVVDLITLPRDTLTTAPGHRGFYKLNGVFNVGLGGWTAPTGQADELADGFLLTCRAAEEWLGGISIPYYYGLDFQAVVDIVDAIGGIDYDVDVPYHTLTGKAYGKGMQHLDGDAVMGYLRIRYEDDGLDSSRTARQRKMLVAIFTKLKNEGKLSTIPSLIAAANSGIYTNTTLSQTTALATYAMQLDEGSIRTRSMFGEISTIEVNWRFAYVDQQNRIDLIREVFGIEAEPVGICTRQYERWLYSIGFSALKYMSQAEKVLNRVQELRDAGETFTAEQITLYSDCYVAYLALQEGFDTATDILGDRYAAAPWREKTSDQSKWTEQNKTEDAELTALEQNVQQNISALQASLRKSTVSLAESIGYRQLIWSMFTDWYKDPDINEVIVAFG